MTSLHVTARSSESHGPRLRLDLPEGWQLAAEEDPQRAVATMPTQDAGPFLDNLVVTIEDLPDTIEPRLDAVRTVSLLQMHGTVPDLHVLDDRGADLDGRDAWFRASLATGPENITITARQVFALVGGHLLTLALTSLPFRDAEASDHFAHVVGSCRITADTMDGQDR